MTRPKHLFSHLKNALRAISSTVDLSSRILQLIILLAAIGLFSGPRLIQQNEADMEISHEAQLAAVTTSDVILTDNLDAAFRAALQIDDVSRREGLLVGILLAAVSRQQYHHAIRSADAIETFIQLTAFSYIAICAAWDQNTEAALEAADRLGHDGFYATETNSRIAEILIDHVDKSPKYHLTSSVATSTPTARPFGPPGDACRATN